MDGIYTMTYRGLVDWGAGMLVLRRGIVTGADAAGGLYDGRYAEGGDSVLLDLTMTVPAGVPLVVGTPAQPRPYQVVFKASAPKSAIETGAPFLVELSMGLVNVIIRRLRTLED